MKQKEKVNLVLRKLYDLRYDQYSHTLTSIMKELNIFENDVDMRHLAKRLEVDGLAKITRTSGGVDAEISTYGIDYYEENFSGAMKQSEKSDRILRWLYEHRDKGSFTRRLEAIMEELGIYESRDEAERIAEDLVSRDFVTMFPIEDGAGIVAGIKSRGVSYCEGAQANGHGAASYPGIIIYGGFSANNAVLGNNNSHFEQSNAASIKEAENLINTLREDLQKCQEIDDEKKEVLIDYVDDIEESVKAQKPVRQIK